MYTYISRLYVYISRFSCPVPVIYPAFRFATLPPSCRFSRVLLFVPPFPLPRISLFLSLGTSLASSEHVLLALSLPPPPLSPIPDDPVLQLALRSVLLPHFAFKVRLSLPNNILSLDTSPCEGGRRPRHLEPPDASTLDERYFFFFSFPTLTRLFHLYSQLNMIFFSRDRRRRSPNKPN